MSYPINYPTPQGANVQIFTSYMANPETGFDWVKPQGASFVWFTLIGPGGNGNGTTGGGSGAVTNFMCPAFLIPDVLSINPGTPSNNAASVRYRLKTGATSYLLLSANHASGASAASAMTANYFTAMGFFQSVAGQAGTTGALSASTTTFLSGGTDGTNVITSNYGYTTNSQGYFQLQPIIVGVGCNDGASGVKRPGIGCGGSATGSFPAGPGMVVIITW